MLLSKKTIATALLILGSFSGTCLADALSPYIYIPEHKDTVIDDAAGRRYLTGVPGIDTSQIWFITGNTYFEDENSSCLRARDLWLFSKPIRSSDGIWRGKKAYLTQKPDTECGKTVNTSPIDLNIDTVTFTDPHDQHPEEAWDGVVPGIFQIYSAASDKDLLNLSNDVQALHACLKESTCPYPIDLTSMGSHAYEYIPAIKPKNILSLSEKKQKDGPCYQLIFAKETDFSGAIAAEICYSRGKVSKVEMDDQVIE